MAAKMAVYYNKYEKIFPETGKLQGFAYRMLFYWFLNYKHYRCNIQVMKFMHYSEFDIFKMASRIVADKFNKPMGAAPYL